MAQELYAAKSKAGEVMPCVRKKEARSSLNSGSVTAARGHSMCQATVHHSRRRAGTEGYASGLR